MRLKSFCLLLAVTLTWMARGAGMPGAGIIEDDNSYTLTNGVLAARIAKNSGDLISLRYQNQEMLDAQSGRARGYWSHNVARGRQEARITINPATNGGERAEISIKGYSDGAQLGSGPGGSVVADIEIRYALGRGVSGLYTYSIFTHPTNYPATSIGEARFCLKLNDGLFDWMTVDSNRNLRLISAYDWNHGTPMNMKEARRMNTGEYEGQVEHKYDYSANQFDVRTWGWSSSRENIGLWFINPSVEYLSGGPTKFELSAHRDATFNTNAPNAPAAPTLLNYWRSSHYGGSLCNIAATDNWTKVVGPFLIYCNHAPNRADLWPDALAREKIETAAWPFDWVNGVDYPHKAGRATVTGNFVLKDPQMSMPRWTNLLVGLTAPDYAPAIIPRGRGAFGGGFGPAGGGEDETNYLRNLTLTNTPNADWNTNLPPRIIATDTNNSRRAGMDGFRGRSRFGRGGFNPGPRIVDWQSDAKNYQFWVRADADGHFSIPNVRPGHYTLHAIADGVLGEFTLTNLTVSAGQKLALGNLDWQPVRHGKQLWDIGIPNRTGAEFFKGDDYFHWGWYLEYPKLFPNDVHFTIGKSDFRKDWFFEQVPHNENPDNRTGTGPGRSTTWTITFQLPETPHGKATLRLAICGIGARNLAVAINDQPAGNLGNLVYNATINRDGIGGSWIERDLAFDAGLMKAGENQLTLTIPPGGLTSGLLYDYLRLELDEAAPAHPPFKPEPKQSQVELEQFKPETRSEN